MKEVPRKSWGRGQGGGCSQGRVQERWMEATQEETVEVEAR